MRKYVWAYIYSINQHEILEENVDELYLIFEWKSLFQAYQQWKNNNQSHLLGDYIYALTMTELMS